MQVGQDNQSFCALIAMGRRLRAPKPEEEIPIFKVIAEWPGKQGANEELCALCAAFARFKKAIASPLFAACAGTMNRLNPASLPAQTRPW
jgi:hypothetical protein